MEALSREQAFAAWQQRPKGFKGTCNHCGKYGHNGVDGFQRKKNRDGAKPTGLILNLEVNVGFVANRVIKKSECHCKLNVCMKDNMTALAQTTSLFDQKRDDESDTQYNYSE